jgi:AcrR family transcriptional regulator
MVMEFQTATALRHKPKQPRGQRKVEQILRSAEAVFAEVGYEQATTNAVANHAHVSIGSLYQFFAGKDAILEAMAQGYLDQMQSALVRMLETNEDRPLRPMLTELIETLVKLQSQRPFFLQCLGQSHAYTALEGSVKELNTVVTRHVVGLLKRISAPADEATLERRAQVCVRTVSSLLPLALAARGKRRASIIDETVTLLQRYLEPELLPEAS